MLEWLQANKEWVFEGIGVSVLVGFVSWFLVRREGGSASTAKQVKQKQRGGRSSTNIQIGSIGKDQ